MNLTAHHPKSADETRRVTSEFERAAAHEAGHAVLAHFAGAHVREQGLTCAPDGTGQADIRGYVVVPRHILPRKIRTLADRSTKVWLAHLAGGYVTEFRWADDPRDPWELTGTSDDYCVAERYSRSYWATDDDDFHEGQLRAAYKLAKKLLDRPGAWVAVTELTAALLHSGGHVTADQVHGIIHRHLPGQYRSDGSIVESRCGQLDCI